MWASRYETRLGELWAVERSVAETVGVKIGVAPASPAGAASRKPTEDLEAHTLYRQGRHYALMQTPEGFAAARRCFEQAIERDPQFALAHNALAEFWWYFDFMGFAPPKTVAGIGMAHALRAIELDGSLAEAHALLGHFRWPFDYDWPAVRRHVDEARDVLARMLAEVARQPYVPPTSLAWTYLGLGDADNAFVWLDRAVEASDRMMVPIQLYWFFDPLRGDPRFADLLRRMKLSPLAAGVSNSPHSP